MWSFGSLPALFVCILVCFFVCLYLLPHASPLHPHPLYVPCLFPRDLYAVYWAFCFYRILLTLVGIPMLNLFTSKPKVDVGNAVCPSILFPVIADVIKDYLKYWRPYQQD